MSNPTDRHSIVGQLYRQGHSEDNPRSATFDVAPKYHVMYMYIMAYAYFYTDLLDLTVLNMSPKRE